MAWVRRFARWLRSVREMSAQNHWRILIRSAPRPFLRSALFFLVLLFFCVSIHAQTQQPFLITAPAGVPAGTNLGASTFARNDTTGAISLLPNTTVNFLNPCAPDVFVAADLLLFGPCGDGLSMYTLNGTSGVVAEVPTSPFAASTTNSSAAIAAEATGQYVYLLKANFSGFSSANNLFLDTFQIDQQALTLVPVSSQNLPFTGAWVDGGVAVDPNGHGFAVVLNQNQGGAEPVPVLYLVTFDPASGLPILPSSGSAIAGVNAQSLHISPKGQYLSVNYGQNGEFLNVYQLSTSNFQVTALNTLNVGAITFAARGVFFDPSGTLIYVQTLNPDSPPGEYTYFAVFDAATLTAQPATITFEQANNISCGPADPFGPFVYCENLVSGSEYQGIAVYQVDPITGVPTAVPNSPFYSTLAIFPVVFTNSTAQQGSGTPSLGWSPSSLTFPATTAGQSSAAQTITFKNVGTLPVTFSSATISGANPGDFSKNDQCTPLVILSPGLTCTISITYTPANAGTSQAILAVTDDAAGSPQQIGLAGTALAPTPAASLSPSGTFNFPGTITQGTNSSPQNFVLTNTGSGALHVTSIIVTGFNANDFVVGTSNCLGAVAPSAMCSIPVTFSPLAAGIRTTTLQITDDAAGSPQTVTLNGTASAAQLPRPSPPDRPRSTIFSSRLARVTPASSP